MNRLSVVTLAAIVAISMLGCAVPANGAKAPVITSISPSSAIAGGPGFTLTVDGSNFNGNSYLLWNGSQRPTVMINSTQLQAFISSADIAIAGTVQVAVVDPRPFPQKSNSTSLTINPVLLTTTTSSIAAPAPSSLQITTTSLPGGAVGVSYGTTLAGANGVSPYAWSVIGGQLPPGLALQASTGQIPGNPTQAGTFGFLVQLKDSSGQATSTNLSIVVALLPAPTVGSVSPNSGSTAGGTSVTISGANFQAGASVLFGGVAASSATVSSATQIQAVTPAHAPGTVNVVVQNPDGQLSTLSSGFVYNNPPPSVSSVSPNTGSAAGGTSVTITGTNFLAGALVLFGTAPASGVTVSSAAQVQAVSPANAAGTVDVTVQNPDGQFAKLTGGFTYTAPAPVGTPTIAGVSPNFGTPGTQVTINGTNFGSGATVAFGGTNAASTVFVSATQLTAAVPAIAAGVVDVKVTNSGGSSATLAGGFTVTKAQSLLTGMTPSNFTLPPGWTLVTTQDFESGSIGPNEYLVGGSTISSSFSHTGTHSLKNTIGFDAGATQWGVFQNVIGTSRHIYLSYWRYFDTNASGSVEVYFANAYTNNRNGIFNVMDTQNYAVPLGQCSDNQTVVLFSSSNSPAQDPNFAHVGGPYDLSSATGKWEQVEWEFQGNVNGSSDSIVRLYINGVKIYEELNTNVNGTLSAVGMAIEAGPLFTYETSTGGSTTPCNGSFNAYIDDIILLKQ